MLLHMQFNNLKFTMRWEEQEVLKREGNARKQKKKNQRRGHVREHACKRCIGCQMSEDAWNNFSLLCERRPLTNAVTCPGSNSKMPIKARQSCLRE
jgi:hypothetical protein